MKPAAIAMILVAGLSTTAQAVETGTLTLACKGTIGKAYQNVDPEPLSMGLVVNFTAGTVQGFPHLQYVPIIKITGMNETTVEFGGSNDYWSFSGTIDRVTGDVQALQNEMPDVRVSFKYLLKCKPTQRMF
jgi:hypothetical protein